MNLSEKKVIIWDWNGTLLDDVDFCVENMNVLLRRRGLPPIDKTKYKNIFTFPVLDYYKKVGINLEKEGFEKPAHEYIDLYFSRFDETRLFPCVPHVLETLRQKGYKQAVLSAMEHGMLKKTLQDKGILSFFDVVTGIGDHYGTGKVEAGLKLMEELNYSPAQALMVGDTLHDKEVADAMGVDIVLLNQGHFSDERLKKAKVPVLDNLQAFLKLLES